MRISLETKTRNQSVVCIIALVALMACTRSQETGLTDDSRGNTSPVNATTKFTAENCTDPDLSKIGASTQISLCDGTLALGQFNPDPEDIRQGVTVAGVVGTFVGGPDPWDVRSGVSIGTSTGRIKLNCRNLVGLYDGTGYTGGSTVAHNIEDFNYDGAASSTFPTTNPWPGGDEHHCSPHAVEPTWETVLEAGDQSVFKDKITNLHWSRGTDLTARPWSEAEGGAGNGVVEYCHSLNAMNSGSGYGGLTNWRLATYKEILTAYSHGIYAYDDDNISPNNLGNLGFSSGTLFWVLLSRSTNGRSAQAIRLYSLERQNNFKTSSNFALCVSM